MPVTYEPIANTSGTGSSSTITFNNIPGTFTDLVVVCNFIATTDQNSIIIRFNNDTATNYSVTNLSGFANPPTSGRTTNATSLQTMFASGSATGNPNPTILHVFNYANTTTNKTSLMRVNGTRSGAFEVLTVAGLWRKTPEAITRIDVINAGGNMTTTSTFALYGIKAA